MDLEVIGVVQRQNGGLTPCVRDSQCGSIVAANPYFRIYRRSLQLMQVNWREIMSRIWFLIKLMLRFEVLDLHIYSLEHSHTFVHTVVDLCGIVQLSSTSTWEELSHYRHFIMLVHLLQDEKWVESNEIGILVY